MKKTYYYWIAAAIVVIAIAVGLFLWKGDDLTGEQAEAPAIEEVAEREIVLRELQPQKADEEKFFGALRQLAGASFDSLSNEQKLNALLQLADDHEATNRLLAVQKLGEIETSAHSRVDKLIAKLQDENPWVVEEAILALAKLRAAEAAAPLRQLLAELQKQPAIEYVPFASTAMMAVHGRVQANGEKNDFNFQLSSFAKSASNQPTELNAREKMALFILPEFEWCVNLPNFKTNWEKLQNSAFAKQLVQLQAWQDFKAAAPFNRFFTLQDKLRSELGPLSSETNDLLSQLGDEVYLAAYPAEEGSHLLLVTPANLKARTVNATLKALGKARSGDVTIEKQTYRGESLFHVYLNDKKASLFRYAVVDDYLVLADDERVLVRAIASYKDNDESSLAYQSVFRQSWQQIDDASFLLVYLDPQKFFDLNKDRQISETLVATAEKALHEIAGAPASLPADSLSLSLSPAETTPPVDEQTLRFIPANAIFCYATTAINPQQLWRYVITRRAEKEAIKSFETRSNLNLERDLIRKMDNRLLYFFAGIDTVGPRFFRRQLLGVHLREQKDVEPYGKRLLKYLYSPKDEIQAEDYEGARLYYVKSPTTFEPNFAVVNDYLLLAFDRATLKAAIDAGQKRAEAIEKNSALAAARRLEAPENSLVYFNPENFLDNYQNYLAAYDRTTNLFDRSDLQTRIDPLFALVKANVQAGAGKISAAGNGQILIGIK
jgi:hypothetical protein